MGDVAGGGGAAAAAEAQKRGRPMDADTLARLRKEASETHGAPHELPDECLKSWIKFSTSKIELDITAKGVFLKTLGGTEESNYHVYYSPVFVEGRYKLKCRLYGCGSVHSFFSMKDKKLQGIFSDAKRHLLICPGRPFLTEEDVLVKKMICMPTTSSSSSSSS